MSRIFDGVILDAHSDYFHRRLWLFWGNLLLALDLRCSVNTAILLILETELFVEIEGDIEGLPLVISRVHVWQVLLSLDRSLQLGVDGVACRRGQLRFERLL